MSPFFGSPRYLPVWMQVQGTEYWLRSKLISRTYDDMKRSLENFRKQNHWPVATVDTMRPILAESRVQSLGSKNPLRLRRFTRMVIFQFSDHNFDKTGKFNKYSGKGVLLSTSGPLNQWVSRNLRKSLSSLDFCKIVMWKDPWRFRKK